MVFSVLGSFFAWTWFIWACVFVICMVEAISRSVQEALDGNDHRATQYSVWACLALAVILGGIVSLFFM